MDIVERLGELRLGNKEYDVVVDAIDEIKKLREDRSRLREVIATQARERKALALMDCAEEIERKNKLFKDEIKQWWDKRELGVLEGE